MDYTASVDNEVTSVTVTPSTADAAASVTVAGTDTTSGTASGANNLNVGANEIRVVVTAEDGSTTKTYTVTVTRGAPPNQPPVAEAGDPQSVTTGATVTLTGSATDPDTDDVLTYAWAHTSTDGDTPATVIPLTNADTATATFTAPDTAAVLVFTLTVTDDSGDSATNTGEDTVTITVTAPPKPLIVGSGAVSHPENTETVTTFTATDAAGDPVSVTWELTGADVGLLSIDDSSGRLGFTNDPDFEDPLDADNDNDYQVTITATDSATDARSEPLEVTVTVINEDETGTIGAIIGSAQVGQTLTAGAITDPDSPDPSRPVTVTGWQWQGDSTNIDGATSETYMPVVADIGKTIRVIVTYTDGHGPGKTLTSAPTEAVIAAPASTDADLSGLTIADNNGTTVVLDPIFDAASPDTEDYTASVANGITSVTLTPTTAAAAASVTVAGTDTTSGTASGANNLNVGANEIRVVVTAEDGTTTKTYTVTVTRAAPANQPPVAEAGDPQSVTTGTVVTLTGSATDPDGDDNALTYSWTQTSGTPNVTLSGADTATATFTAPDTAAVLIFTLTVTDDSADSATNTGEDTVTITVTAPLAISAGPALTSSNSNVNFATDGDTLSLTFTVNVALESAPTVTIAGQTVTATNTGNDYTATYLVVAAQVMGLEGTLVSYDIGAMAAAGVPANTLDPEATESAIRIDVTAPSVTTFITPDANGVIDVQQTHDITFSEPVTGLDSTTLATVITTTGGVTVDSVTDTNSDQTTYTITFTPTAETFSLTLAANSVADLAGLTGPANDVSASGTAVAATVNQPPVANAGADQDVTTGVEVTLTGSATDPDDNDDALTYSWVHTSTDSGAPSPAITLSSATTATATFTAPDTAAVLVFTLTVTDDSGDSATNTGEDTVTITVTAPVNTAPVIVGSGTRSVAENTEAVATFTATDDEGNEIKWTLSGVDASQLSISSRGRLDFMNDPDYEAPLDAGRNNVYEVIITATETDGTGLTDTLAVTVTVTNVDETGSIAAIDGTPQVGLTLTAGAITDPDSPDPSRPVTVTGWRWQGDSTNIDGATSATYTPAEADLDKTIRVMVTYTDGHGPGKTITSAPTDAVIAAQVINQPPTANAGVDQSVTTGATVTLTGAASSDSDGTIQSYEWVHTSTDDAPPATAIIVADGETSTFTAPGAAAVLVFTLTVTDDSGDSATNTGEDTVTITVTAPPKPLIVGSGAVSHPENTETVTTFTATDAAGDPVSVTWELTGADVGLLSIDDSSGRLGFTNDPDFEDPLDADNDNDYQVTITATDSATDARSEPLEVTVTVINEDETGTIGAIIGSAQVGNALTAGAVTDPDNVVAESIIYQWQDAGDSTNIDGATSATYTPAEADLDKTIRVMVTYTDGHGPGKTLTSAPTDAVIAAQVINQPPTANAGVDQSATFGATVTLTGAASSDSDGTIQSYEWVHTSTDDAPPATAIIVADGETSTFTAPATAAVLVFTLTVTDDSGDSATNTGEDTVTITVTAPLASCRRRPGCNHRRGSNAERATDPDDKTMP